MVSSRTIVRSIKSKKASYLNRSDPEYLKLIRTLPCCVDGCRSGTTIHAHHVRSAATSGMGMKPADKGSTIPICGYHHQELHRIGNKTFEAAYGLDIALIARELAANLPQRIL